MTYKIKPYTYEKAKEMKLTLKPSTNVNKKIDAFKDGKKIASIGAIGYLDYPTYILKNGLKYANERKKLYHIRHKKDNKVNGILAKKLLW